MKSPEKYALDTNVIVRYVLGESEPNFPQAKQIMDAIEDGVIVAELDPVILGEVIWVLKSFYKVTTEEILEGVIPIVQSEHIDMVEKDRYLTALKLYGGIKHFGDACVCTLAMESSDGKVLSFDRKLSKVAGIRRVGSL